MKRFFANPLLFLAVLAAAAHPAAGEEIPPIDKTLYVGAAAETVVGIDGLPLPDGSYIEFRAMYKPSATLLPITYSPESSLVDSRNRLLATSFVGAGVTRPARGRGRFAACVGGMDTTNSYVVRLFHGSTPGESLAYCDSRPFTYDADETRTVTNVQFTVWKALDGSPLEDTDGDGLVDIAEEKITGTEPDDWDSDGDGFSDGFEHTHGMDPLQTYELAIRLTATPVDESLLDADAPPMHLYDVTWASVSGLTYNLEYLDDMLAPEENWTYIATVTASNAHTAVPIDDWHLTNSAGFFRVWTVLPRDGVPAGE